MLKSSRSNVPELKSAREIDLMREAGKVVAEALRVARQLAQPGARTSEIDKAVEEVYNRHGAIPLFKNYPGKVPFPASTCIALNEQVVHGIPGQRALQNGDLVKIDTACKLNGWCADSAICFPVGKVSAEIERLLKVAKETLEIGIRECGRRHWWSEVAMCMYKHVQNSGFSTVEKYVGHGIGKNMHEPPQVPNYSSRDLRKQDCRLEPGLVLAIEPMINLGRKEVQTLPDRWTVITKDRLPSVHVEHTVAITADGVQILTVDNA